MRVQWYMKQIDHQNKLMMLVKECVHFPHCSCHVRPNPVTDLPTVLVVPFSYHRIVPGKRP